MAIYRQVHISFWQDPWVEELDPEQKYFYLFLLTNSKTRQCGCYEIGKKVMKLETGLADKKISELLRQFVKYKKIEYNQDTNEILMRNWLKYNSYRSPKVRICIENELKDIKYEPFREYLRAILDGEDADSVSIDYPESMDTDTEEKKKPTHRTIPPTVEEIKEYCKERKNGIDAEVFYDHYQARGWVAGKTKMKDWKAAVRTWERNKKTDPSFTSSHPSNYYKKLKEDD